MRTGRRQGQSKIGGGTLVCPPPLSHELGDAAADDPSSESAGVWLPDGPPSDMEDEYLSRSDSHEKLNYPLSELGGITGYSRDLETSYTAGYSPLNSVDYVISVPIILLMRTASDRLPNVPGSRQALIDDIEAHIAREKLMHTGFGRNAVDDGPFLVRIDRGSDLRPETADRCWPSWARSRWGRASCARARSGSA